MKPDRLELSTVDFTTEDGTLERLSLAVPRENCGTNCRSNSGLSGSTGAEGIRNSSATRSASLWTYWTNRLLQVKPGAGWKAILQNYNGVGRFSLTETLEAWEQINAHTTAEP